MIVTRYLTAASIGLLVTTSLLYLMQLLIDFGPAALSGTPPRVAVDWIQPKIDEQVIVRFRPPERIAPAALVPPVARHSERPSAIGTDALLLPPVPPSASAHTPFRGVPDGPLVSLIKVRPNYPATALGKGLQGFVTVQFDVTEDGSVGNVIVLESSHPVFESAAIEAAQRFRYKPQVVEGVPRRTHGLQNRFVFELDD